MMGGLTKTFGPVGERDVRELREEGERKES